VATCFALLALRRSGGERPALFQLRGGLIITGAALVLCIWLLASSRGRELRDIGIAAVIGLLFYLIYSKRNTMKTSMETKPNPRRNFLGSIAASIMISRSSSDGTERSEGGAMSPQDAPTKLGLQDFQPKSMLVVPEHPTLRARYPVIDVHTHISSVFGQGYTTDPNATVPDSALKQLDQIVSWMDQLNIKTLNNLTGGYGETLKRNVSNLQGRYKGRFLNCVVPAYERLREANYPAWQAEELQRARDAGAIGLKITKTLGVYLRENGKDGSLVKIDDPRFDPMWEAAGKLKMPVFIHTADPDAFFTPIDRFNERWEELSNHPDWSFYGKDYPPKADLLSARNRVIERHPRTTFVGLHVANHPENLDEVANWLNRYPNLQVEIGARLGELGRQPRRARKFFEDYQDRIMFGTDATPNGNEVPQQDLKPAMFQAYFRFLETLDEHFDYAPSPVPPQGRWKIYGIGLPDQILKKVYSNNAARLLGLPTI
jgi:predicted TIM-barrel fold metal-dependent hydrolase